MPDIWVGTHSQLMRRRDSARSYWPMRQTISNVLILNQVPHLYEGSCCTGAGALFAGSDSGVA